jgi:hypothetical protein
MRKILVILAVIMGVNFAAAQQTKKESPWTEIQVVEIPQGQRIYEGVTKNGNPKYWFEFGELKVNVSPGSAIKYKEGATKLLLVKCQHKDTGKYKYSIRQKERAKKNTPNVDLNSLF